MGITIYNSMTKSREAFEPRNAPVVQMYCCGPTVYDLLHVGNFRGVIVYNFVRQWLEERGYKVNFVYNYTDVDDKIINRALKENRDSADVAKQYIEEFEKDFGRLKLRKHDANPKVTETMDEIRSLVGQLIEGGKAYVTEGTSLGKDVNFAVRSFEGYGKLSHRNIDDMMSGTRVEVDEKKRDPLDFALWKAAKPGEPSWDSPWGQGRPGWHIECSAMVRKHLGESIDIHGGGMDLIFPHHENEIAQSEGASGHQYVKYWMHNNMINFGGAKMSKSIGNIKTARGFMDEYNPEILKFMMMSVHYRSTLDLGEEAVDQAIAGLARVYSALALAESLIADGKAAGLTEDAAVPADFSKTMAEAWEKASHSFDDDFNSAEGIARLFEIVRAFNAKVRRGMKVNAAVMGTAVGFRNFASNYGRLMSVFAEPPAQFLTDLDNRLLKRMNLDRAEIELIVKERAEARNAKDFAKSDELRKLLTDKGISISDTTQGSFWEVSK
ncbi:MAG: cysteine--tRNA ligase [Bdellovibrionaceae bacterium]|nr:cysteine--tRNA ligase [Pseudobdellovibrionaceae bacterium]